jgi:hypothetical protein
VKETVLVLLVIANFYGSATAQEIHDPVNLLVARKSGSPKKAHEAFGPIKWILRPAAGFTIPISPLSGAYITDNLLANKNRMYFQFISAAYFLGHWGVEVAASANFNNNSHIRRDRFAATVNAEYASNYYVDVYSGGFADALYFNASFKGGIGPVYKIESNRWLFMGRALFGDTSFATDLGSASLKGKGTNELIFIDWTTTDFAKDCFTFNPSFSVGYRISKRLILDVDVNYWLYKIDFSYREQTDNSYTGINSSRDYRYNSLISELSFGIGLIVVLE